MRVELSAEGIAAVEAVRLALGVERITSREQLEEGCRLVGIELPPRASEAPRTLTGADEARMGAAAARRARRAARRAAEVAR